jgi:hypothetical protein
MIHKDDMSMGVLIEMSAGRSTENMSTDLVKYSLEYICVVLNFIQ